MAHNCLICDRIKQIQAGTNPYFVEELETGYVVIGDYQYWQGYTLFLCKIHVEDLHQLDPPFKRRFLDEMSLVAQAVFQAFTPRTMNYELMGNSEPHLHWHLFPRYRDELAPRQPVWVIDKAVRYSDRVKPSTEELARLKACVQAELAGLAGKAGSG